MRIAEKMKEWARWAREVAKELQAKDILILSTPWLLVLAVSLAFILITGCKQIEYVEKPVYRHDTLVINRVQADTLITRDSVYLERGGDTIFLYKYKYVDRVKYKTDSVYVSKCDTITICKEVLVEKSLTFKEKVFLWVGGRFWWVILLLLAFVVFSVVKRFIKR